MVSLISSTETTKKLAEKVAQKMKGKNLFSISAENVSTIGINMNMSTTKTIELGYNLRVATKSRKAVGQGLKEQVYNDRHRRRK